MGARVVIRSAAGVVEFCSGAYDAWMDKSTGALFTVSGSSDGNVLLTGSDRQVVPVPVGAMDTDYVRI